MPAATNCFFWIGVAAPAAIALAACAGPASVATFLKELCWLLLLLLPAAVGVVASALAPAAPGLGSAGFATGTALAVGTGWGAATGTGALAPTAGVSASASASGRMCAALSSSQAGHWKLEPEEELHTDPPALLLD